MHATDGTENDPSNKMSPIKNVEIVELEHLSHRPTVFRVTPWRDIFSNRFFIVEVECQSRYFCVAPRMYAYTQSTKILI